MSPREKLLEAAFGVAACKLEGRTHVIDGVVTPNGTVALENAAWEFCKVDDPEKVRNRLSDVQYDLERAREKIKELSAKLDSSERNVRGLMSDARFWRDAARQAVSGWEALEDKLDSAVQILQAATDQALPGDAACKEIDRALELLVELDPLEPDDAPLMNQSVDIGNGQKLTLVEEETPLKGVGIVKDE